MLEQAGVVDLEKSSQGTLGADFSGGAADVGHARGSQRAPDQRRRALANHPRDGVFRQRRAAELHDQFVRGLGEVPAGIDDRAVEIERDQAV